MTHSVILKRTGTVSLLTLISRVAGLIRDMVIAYGFGTRMAADAFFVAFRIPNLLRRLLAEGALTVSFVPIFTESLKKSRDEAKSLADASWTFLFVVLCFVSLVGIVVAPGLVKLIAWGFGKDPEKFALTVSLTRLMFPYILLVSLAAWGMGVLNSVKHFAAPASASIFLNLGIIVGALGLSRIMTPPVLGLALGVLLGGLLQLGIHFPMLRRFGFFPRFTWNPRHPGVQRIVGLMVPASFGAAVYQFNVIIITLLASFLPAGSVAYLWYADRLMEFPVGIFAIALATVLLTSFSDHVAAKDSEGLKSTFRFGLRMALFLALPAAAGLSVLSEPIIRLLFEHGHFSPESTERTAEALIYFAVGLPFISAVRVTSNVFFALKDSKTPVKMACWSVVANLLFSLLLMKPMAHNGLALAVSLAALLNWTLQILALRRKIGPLGLMGIRGGLMKTVVSSSLMAIFVGFFARAYRDSIGPGLWSQTGFVGGLILLGVAIFLALEFLLKGREVRELLALVRRKAVP